MPTPSSPPEVVEVRRPRRPEVIVIDDDGEDCFDGRGGRPRDEGLRITWSGEGSSRVKAEPFDDLAWNSGAPRPAVPVAARGSSSTTRKRAREAPGGAKAAALVKAEPWDAVDWNSGASAAGGGAMGPIAEPGSSRETRKREKRAGKGIKSPARGAGDVGLGRSRPRKSGRGERRGKWSFSANEVLVSSEESGGGGKGCGQRRGGAGRDGAAPVNLAGPSVASRTRSRAGEHSVASRTRSRAGEHSVASRARSRAGEHSVASRARSRAGEQGRVRDAVCSAREFPDDTEEDEEEGEDEKVEEDSGDNNEVGQESEQKEGVKGKEEENDSGDSQNRCEEGNGTDDDDSEEEAKEEKELEEDEDGIQDDSDGIYDDEEENEEVSEEEEEESHEAGEELLCLPSNVMAGSSRVSSGEEGRKIYGKRMFEGLCLPEEADNTIGKGVKSRTRSHSTIHLDKKKKLLGCGIYSKPIDVLESSSESQNDVPPPAQQRKPLSSSGEYEDDGSSDGIAEHRTATNRRRRHGKPNAHSDDSEEAMPFAWDVKEGSTSRRPKKGATYRHTVKDGCKYYDGSNPQYVKNGCSNPGSPSNRCNAQSAISFKKNAQSAQRRKRGGMLKGQDPYDDLINTLFDELENHADDSVPAQRLPLVFSFGDEDEVDEKSEHDELWREFYFALESINIGVQACKECEPSNGQEIPADAAASCNQGKHYLIIDEQIGVRCKYCHFVDLEIRYVLPSMAKLSVGKDSTMNPRLDSLYDDILASNNHGGGCSFGDHKTGLVWDLIPGVRQDMFPHQQEGFEFMWTNLAGGIVIEQLKHTVNTDIVGGCVISHAPGTGKTRLAITFVQSYLEVFPQCRPVIIAPKGMLATWEQEFRKWKVKLPFQVLNSSEIHWNEDKTIQARVPKDAKLSQKSRRMLKLVSWHEGSSIIGVSYSLFRRLAKDNGMDGPMVRKLLLERPDLLVLDEGHTPRNKKSLIWKVLAEVRTEKRIILSGTPFQNNFLELYNILYLVRPKFARDFASKRASQSRAAPHFDSKQDMPLEKDEGKDFWTSLTNHITDKSIDEIREVLKPFVHIHNGDILHKSLPGLRESVVILNPLPHQKKIITTMESTVAMGTLDAEYKISLASVHPSLITRTKLSDKEASVVNKYKSLLEKIRLIPDEGAKTRFVSGIVRLSKAAKERVIVFSQYIKPLSLIKDQLVKEFNWTAGKEVLQMCGKVPVSHREALMKAFNDMQSEAKVMLASTKACCEGITLVGASRVVLLDVVWNPSVGRQAIGRAYRIGQEKIVYTYNLIASGTKEKDKHDRQAKKDHMSKLLFSKELQNSGWNLSPQLIFDDRILEAMTENKELKDMFANIIRLH